MCGYAKLDKIKNHVLREARESAFIFAKMRENKLIMHIRRMESVIVDEKRSCSSPKKTWEQQIRNDMRDLHLFDNTRLWLVTYIYTYTLFIVLVFMIALIFL